MDRPWIRAQVRGRAADIVGPDYDERTYIETVLDGLEADDITDVRQIPADELDRRIADQTLPPADDDEEGRGMTPRPVFVRTDVPGIGSVTAYPDGRFVLGGDIELTVSEFADLVNAVVTAGLTSADEARKTLRRPAHVTDELDQLSDQQ